jgi:hypothetical protein
VFYTIYFTTINFWNLLQNSFTEFILVVCSSSMETMVCELINKTQQFLQLTFVTCELRFGSVSKQVDAWLPIIFLY